VGGREGGREERMVSGCFLSLFFSVSLVPTPTYLEGDELVVRVVHRGNEEE
jgi:hypothetical protein